MGVGEFIFKISEELEFGIKVSGKGMFFFREILGIELKM